MDVTAYGHWSLCLLHIRFLEKKLLHPIAQTAHRSLLQVLAGFELGDPSIYLHHLNCRKIYRTIISGQRYGSTATPPGSMSPAAPRTTLTLAALLCSTRHDRCSCWMSCRTTHHRLSGHDDSFLYIYYHFASGTLHSRAADH